MKIIECAVALQQFTEAFKIVSEKTMYGHSGLRDRGGHDSWEEHSGASGGETERLRRDLEEANRRADTMQERLNLQKQATVQAGIPLGSLQFGSSSIFITLLEIDQEISGSYLVITYFGNAARN
jgi:hypothetical protein